MERDSQFKIDDVVACEDTEYLSGEYKEVTFVGKIEILQYSENEKRFLYKLAGLENWYTDRAFTLLLRK